MPRAPLVCVLSDGGFILPLYQPGQGGRDSPNSLAGREGGPSEGARLQGTFRTCHGTSGLRWMLPQRGPRSLLCMGHGRQGWEKKHCTLHPVHTGFLVQEDNAGSVGIEGRNKEEVKLAG